MWRRRWQQPRYVIPPLTYQLLVGIVLTWSTGALFLLQPSLLDALRIQHVAKNRRNRLPARILRVFGRKKDACLITHAAPCHCMTHACRGICSLTATTAASTATPRALKPWKCDVE